MPFASVVSVLNIAPVALVSVIVQSGTPDLSELLSLKPEMLKVCGCVTGGGVFVKFWFVTSAPITETTMDVGVTFFQPGFIVSVTVYVPFARPVN